MRNWSRRIVDTRLACHATCTGSLLYERVSTALLSSPGSLGSDQIVYAKEHMDPSLPTKSSYAYLLTLGSRTLYTKIL